jgi:hypothetical protein
MAYEFTPYEQELEPQASGARLGGPPRKHTAAGVLDPPIQPRKQPSPTPAIPRTTMKVLAVAILLGLITAALMMLWK